MYKSRQFNVLVIRPYPSSIRKKVFAAIESAGGYIAEDWIVAAETPDTSLLNLVEALQPDVLLLPFNPHEDHLGNAVNGFTALQHLPHLFSGNVPILMPVSPIGIYSCKKAFENSKMENKQRLLLIEQGHIDSSGLPELIVKHLEKVAR